MKFTLCRYDVAGYSPLAHCTSGMGDMAATLEIAMKVLGLAGADPNAVNRFKVPPLEDAIMTSRADTLTVRRGRNYSVCTVCYVHLAIRYTHLSVCV